MKIVDKFQPEIQIPNVCKSNSNSKTEVRKFELRLTWLTTMHLVALSHSVCTLQTTNVTIKCTGWGRLACDIGFPFSTTSLCKVRIVFHTVQLTCSRAHSTLTYAVLSQLVWSMLQAFKCDNLRLMTDYKKISYRWPNSSVDLVSVSLYDAGEQQMTIVVRALPPRLSCRMRVSLLSRYGMNPYNMPHHIPILTMMMI